MDIRLKDGTILSNVLTEDLDALVKLGVLPHAEYADSVKSAFEVLYPNLETEQSTLGEGLNFNPIAVTIGNQVWTATNLAIDDGGEGIYKNPENNEVYYTWEAAIRVAKTIPGWHLPTTLEWNEAALACEATEIPYEGNPNFDNYMNVQELKDKLGVKLAGYYDGSFSYVGSSAYFWTATERSSANAYYRTFSTGTSVGSTYDNKNYGRSVRLVKDSA